MKTSRILTNVGWYRDKTSSTFHKAYLAVTENNEYFITFIRPATNIAGTAYPKAWAILSYSWIQTGNTENSISQNVMALLYPGVIAFGDGAIIEGSYVNFASGVIINGSALFDAAGSTGTTAAEVTALKAVLPYTELGTGITEDQIKALLGIDSLPNPVQNDALTGITVVEVFPTLDKQPVEAVQAFIKKPIDFAKANPISAGAIVLGVVQLGNFAGLWSPNPLGLIGVKSKTTKKKAALGF